MYNRSAYNHVAYNRPGDKTIWLDVETMKPAGKLNADLARLFYVDPADSLHARADLAQAGLTKIYYVEPQALKSPAHFDNTGNIKTINVSPENIISEAHIESVETVAKMFPDLEKLIGAAEFEKFAAQLECRVETSVAATAALKALVGVTSNVSIDMASAAFLDVLDNDVFKDQEAEIDINIQPGETLVIDRETYTATLDSKNVLEKYFGAWFMALPETISYVIEYDGVGLMQAQIEYTELWY